MTALVSPLASALDPFRACPGGRYDDGVVRVERMVGRPWPGRVDAFLDASRTPDGRIRVAHRLPAALVDDEVGVLLADALTPFTDDHDVFARAFCGLVLTTAVRPDQAWQAMYRNTLALLDRPGAPGYSGVHRHALALLPGTSVLDLGCSLGFLSLHLAARGVRVTACETDAGTVELLRHVARRLDRTVDVLRVVPAVAGAPALPEVADRSVDAVALLHVLEHVDGRTATALVRAALRIARRRVVVAVPYETGPTRLYGHVRTVDAAELHRLGATSGWAYQVHDHLGGWLVLDRPPAPEAGRPTGRPNPGEGERS